MLFKDSLPGRGPRLLLVALTLTLASSQLVAAEPKRDSSPYPTVKFETSAGDFVLRLDRRRAPLTVKNFVTYVEDGFYTGTIFHRVIPGFMAQGGGYAEDFAEKATRPPIPNEAGNGLSNQRGTIAMARLNPPHTGSAQFFINLADNKNLDPSARRWGYAVFGAVTEGMETLDKIAAIPTGASGPFRSDVPQEAVVIKAATLVKQ